jgi:hypothetical protein
MKPLHIDRYGKLNALAKSAWDEAAPRPDVGGGSASLICPHQPASPYRQTFPVKRICTGCSFQLGRTSTFFPPHSLHFKRD